MSFHWLPKLCRLLRFSHDSVNIVAPFLGFLASSLGVAAGTGVTSRQNHLANQNGVPRFWMIASFASIPPTRRNAGLACA